MFTLPSQVLADGLAGVQKDMVQKWIGPVFLLIVAGLALKFLKDQQWMKFASFIAIAAVVGVLIYGTDALFGSSGNLTGAAKKVSGKVNALASGEFAGVGTFIRSGGGLL